MKRLDFSDITTEQLQHAIEVYTKGGSLACFGIACNDCPYCVIGGCHLNNTTNHEGFKEELKRRNEMNKEKYITTHEELLKLHGKEITCKILGMVIEDGKIAVENERVYICQNKQSGLSCSDKLGYKYSWICSSPLDRLENIRSVRELKLKNPNGMPEIKPGMVVKNTYPDGDSYLNLVVGYTETKDLWGTAVDNCTFSSAITDGVSSITKVYKVSPCPFEDIEDNLELIWELKPPKTEAELKLEELEETIKKAQDQIKELKESK